MRLKLLTRRKITTTKELIDELSRGVTWRPKVCVINPRYPKVTAKGCYFIESSGGFDLIHRKTNKYLGPYTKADIAELEKKYGEESRASAKV